MRAWLQLGIAILIELVGTSLLKVSAGFEHFWLGALGMALYALAIFSFSLALKKLPLSVSYAIWSGVGTAVSELIGIWGFHEMLTGPKLIGFVAIVAGVILLNQPARTKAIQPEKSKLD